MAAKPGDLAPTGPGSRSPLRAAWPPWSIAAGVGLTAVAAVVLHLMGRRLWCACGSPVPWSWNIWSQHNSQHLIDPYTVTHVLHGALYYALLWLVCGARSPSLRALVALSAEVAWEIAENTDAVIRAYRDSTMALNYQGDTILNSLGDILGFVAGYIAAMSLPVWVSAAGFVVAEAALLVAIRDSLLLNVLMLVHPIAAIKAWQLGG